MKGYTIRWAGPDDGWAIAALMRTCGYNPEGLDWSRPDPYWLVAEQDGLVIGCIQLCYSKPTARIDMVGIDPRMKGHYGAKLYRDIVTAGIVALREFGAQSILGFVSFDRKFIKRFYQKFGGVILTQGHLMELRLAWSSGMPSQSMEVQDGRRQQEHHDGNPESPADSASGEAA